MRLVLCFAAFVSLFVLSQTTNAQEYSAISYMRIAAQVARNLDRPTLDDYYGWTISAGSWHESLNDALFGPFLAAQEESPTHTMSCIIKQFTNNDVVCVYFNGQSAYGYAALKGDVGHHFTVEEVKGAYKPMSADLLEKHEGTAATGGDKKSGDGAAPLQDADAVRAAAAIAYNLQHDSLDYFNGFILHNDAWHNALQDSLFGAFLAAQDEKPGRQLVCVMSELYNDATCVYFQDRDAYGYVSLKVDSGHKYTVEEVKAAYRAVTPALRQFPAGKGKIKIIEGQYELDNKTMIPADIITEGAS